MRPRILVALPFVLAVAAFTVAQPAKPKADSPLGKVPGNSVAFISLDAAKAWDHVAFGSIREARGKLEFTWALQSLFGVAPAEMERITAFWIPAGSATPFLMLTGRKPLEGQTVAKTLARKGAKSANAKPVRNVFSAPGAEFSSILQVDARTLLLAPEGLDPASLETIATGKAGVLTAAIEAAGKHVLTIGVDVSAISGFPLPVGAPLLEAETAVLTADLGEKATGKAELRLAFPEASQAAKAAPLLKTKLDELAGWAAAQEKRAIAKGSETSGYPGPLLDWIAKTLKNAKVKADGKVATATVDLKIDEALNALMTAIPDAALAARGSSAAENNMKQICLAIITYADANNGNMPSNTYDKEGKPLLSWRVQLLPYIEQAALYQRFKLDEAWDSDNNKPWSQTIIKLFQAPGRPAPQPSETYFRGFIAPKDVKAEHRPWLVEGQNNSTKFPANFTDGTSNTWLVAEAAAAVPWSKPDDLPYDGIVPLPKLGGPSGSYVVGFADGSVRTFRRGQIDDKTIRNLISMADGNVVNIPNR